MSKSNVTILLYVGIAVLLTGCEVLKTKRRATTDSLSVKKVDSTVTHKVEISDKRDSTWWREIINFLPKGDTVVNHITNPVHNYPVQIIREGGSFSREDLLRIVDSAAMNKTDTVIVATAIDEKGKETKVLTQWWIWAIMGLLGVLVIMLTGGRYFKITKK